MTQREEFEEVNFIGGGKRSTRRKPQVVDIYWITK
jgi:hypothetical protein